MSVISFMNITRILEYNVHVHVRTRVYMGIICMKNICTRTYACVYMVYMGII